MLLLVASALLAASAEPAAPQPSPPPATKPKRICRVEQAVTGSLTPKRVCVTVPQAAPAPAQPGQATEKPQASPPERNGTGS
jgi:hypothetical protein